MKNFKTLLIGLAVMIGICVVPIMEVYALQDELGVTYDFGSLVNDTTIIAQSEKVQESSENDIIGVDVIGIDSDTIEIQPEYSRVVVSVEPGTVMTGVVLDVFVSDGAEIVKKVYIDAYGREIHQGDYSNVNLQYESAKVVVKAEDGTEQTWYISLAEKHRANFVSGDAPNLSSWRLDSEIRKADIIVRYGVDIENVPVEINLQDGATLSPVSGTPRDFTNPQEYIVTAPDGKTQLNWIVSVEVGKNYAANIKSISSDEIYGYKIDNNKQEILVTVKEDVDQKNVPLDLIISDHATIDPASGAEVDLSGEVVYKITSEADQANGAPDYPAQWTVKSVLADNVSIKNVKGDNFYEYLIEDEYITLELLPGKIVTNVSPKFELEAPCATISPESGTQQDFTTPVTYTVTAADGKTTKNYIVSAVTREPFNTEAKVLNATLETQKGNMVEGIIDHTESHESITFKLPKREYNVKPIEYTISKGARSQMSGRSLYVQSEDGKKLNCYTIIMEQTQYFSGNAITAIGVTPSEYDYLIDQDTHAVNIEMYPGADLSEVKLNTILSEGATSDIDSAKAYDFTIDGGSKTFIVTAEDGGTQDWAVNIAYRKRSGTSVESFITDIPDATINISGDFSLVDIKNVREGTAMTDIETEITVSEGATYEVTAGSLTDLSQPARILVTAENGNTELWTVKYKEPTLERVSCKGVTIMASKHEWFDASGNPNPITTIEMVLPSGTDLSALTSGDFVFTGYGVAEIDLFNNEITLGYFSPIEDWRVSSYKLIIKTAEKSHGHSNNRKKLSDNNLFDAFVGNEKKGHDEVAGNAELEKDGTVKLTLDKDKVDKILNNFDQDEQLEKKIALKVKEGSKKVKSKMTGEMVKDMEKRAVTLSVDVGDVVYNLPAKYIQIDKVAENLGADIELNDIEVELEVVISEEDITKVKVTNNGEKIEIKIAPVTFKVIAKHEGKTVEVNKFKGYVNRMIKIPDGIEPSNITTAVVILEDGSVRHVPTFIAKINGAYYAVINSLTNSDYTLIWNPVTPVDAVGHWGEDAITNMVSRLVVENVNGQEYYPDEVMDRAEFTAALVKALGLPETEGDLVFEDLPKNNEYYGYIKTAVEYGIVEGYSADSFQPNKILTREEAIATLSRALKITGADKEDYESVASVLSNYDDYKDISTWALKSFISSTHTGLVKGQGNEKLAPKALITRAEVAQLLENALRISKLID